MKTLNPTEAYTLFQYFPQYLKQDALSEDQIKLVRMMAEDVGLIEINISKIIDIACITEKKAREELASVIDFLKSTLDTQGIADIVNRVD